MSVCLLINEISITQKRKIFGLGARLELDNKLFDKFIKTDVPPFDFFPLFISVLSKIYIGILITKLKLGILTRQNRNIQFQLSVNRNFFRYFVHIHMNCSISKSHFLFLRTSKQIFQE